MEVIDGVTEITIQGVKTKVKPLVQLLAGAVVVNRTVELFAVPGKLVSQFSAPVPTKRLFTLVAKVLLGPRRPTCGCSVKLVCWDVMPP